MIPRLLLLVAAVGVLQQPAPFRVQTRLVVLEATVTDNRGQRVTGLTRDGCFWIEKGKISHAVGNMRFTDSVLEGFSRIDAMTKFRKALPTWWNPGGATTAPAIRVRQFRFNGKSQTRVAI